jgi:hypothetical protein
MIPNNCMKLNNIEERLEVVYVIERKFNLRNCQNIEFYYEIEKNKKIVTYFFFNICFIIC